jgi:hypothetical protein
MREAEVPVDREMVAWVATRERELAPEADDFVIQNPAELDPFAVASLGAEALRVAGGADIAFCHPYQIIRNVLPAGPIDVNAVFKTGGQRGHDVIEVDLTGAQIAAYADALESVQREPPTWAGFRRWRSGGTDAAASPTDLDPRRTYRVIMAQMEWESRFLRLAQQLGAREPAHALAAAARSVTRPSPVNFTDAVVNYLRAVDRAGEAPAARVATLVRERESAPQ